MEVKKLQLKFDVYFDKLGADELVLYRLVPKLTKYVLKVEERDIDEYLLFLNELEIGGVDAESISDMRLKSFFDLLGRYHLLCESRSSFSLDSPYLRQLEMFESWDTSDKIPEFYQKKLSRASILVVGAGGLGLPIVNLAVHVGIGTVVVMDADTIERTNLSRQYLYSPLDIGRYKVEVLAERLNQYGLGKVVPVCKWATSDNIQSYLNQYNTDVVTGINVTDSVERMGILYSVLDYATPVLCVNEHSVGPYLFVKDDVEKMNIFLNQFELREQYLGKRRVMKSREMHPSMVTDLSMIGALCVDELVRFISGISKPRLINHAYGMDPVNFIFRPHSLDERW